MTTNVLRMTSKALAQTEQYLYAITESVEDLDLGPFGIDDGLVYAVHADGLAAIVSDIPVGERLRPERRRLAAHNDVLKRLMARFTILPMQFGIVADNVGAVREILAANRDALAEQLQRLAGKVEMGLRVMWDVPNIFEFMVNTHTDLRLVRDQMFRGGRHASQDDKIELGRIFDHLLKDERQQQTERVKAALKTCCFAFKENKLRQEREIMNLACLVGRDNLKEFEQGVFAAANLFDNHYAFDFNGPWAPHNFVAVNLTR
jgi:hypothetical protein